MEDCLSIIPLLYYLVFRSNTHSLLVQKQALLQTNSNHENSNSKIYEYLLNLIHTINMLIKKNS